LSCLGGAQGRGGAIGLDACDGAKRASRRALSDRQDASPLSNPPWQRIDRACASDRALESRPRRSERRARASPEFLGAVKSAQGTGILVRPKKGFWRLARDRAQRVRAIFPTLEKDRPTGRANFYARYAPRNYPRSWRRSSAPQASSSSSSWEEFFAPRRACAGGGSKIQLCQQFRGVSPHVSRPSI
jgi:hypothetical protein